MSSKSTPAERTHRGRTYNILSLDGGGVRGIFTACVLARLNQEHPGFLSCFDLIAGTSTGSILALCLARGVCVCWCG